QTTGFMTVNMAAPSGPDGSFTLNGLAPGEYTLRGQQMGPPQDAEVGILTITVGSDDISGLQLATARSSSVRGQLIVDPAAMSSLPSRMTLMATPVQSMPMMGLQPTPVQDDLSFELKASPGTFRVGFASPAPGWAVRSVRLHGADVTDAGFE